MHAKPTTEREVRRTKSVSTDALPIAPSQRFSSPGTQPENSTGIEPLLDDHDLEMITGRARSSWQKARLTGQGPPFIRLGRLVRYRAFDVEAWLNAHPSLRSTSEAA
jgi:hypothetical protein